MKKYTKRDTIDELNAKLLSIENLYTASCMNWCGTTKDTNELYTEVVAHEVLRNLPLFDNIPQVTRKGSYARESHCKIEMNICESNRAEEMFAKRLAGLKAGCLGIIHDFQVPLKDTLKDKGLGKIDIISYNRDTNTVYLIELKYDGNQSDTLLKAVVQIYTYFKIVDKTKLIEDCFNHQKFILNKAENFVDPLNVEIKPAVLLIQECRAYDELMEIENRPMLKALSLALGIKFFSMELYVDDSFF